MARGGDVRAGKAFVELYLKNNLAKGLRNAGKEMKAFGKGLTVVGGAMTAAGGAILAPLAMAAKHFADVGGKLADLSAQTGVSGAALSELGHAAGLGGASVEQLAGGLAKMRRNVAAAAAGSKPAAAALKALGLSAKDMGGKDAEGQFNAIVGGLEGVKDEGKRSLLAFQLFGKGAQALAPMLAAGTGGLAAMRAEARRLGIAMTDEDVKAADAMGDALDTANSSVEGLSNQVGAALAPTITSLAQKFSEVVSVIIGWVKQNRQLFVQIAKAAVIVTAVGAALIGLGATFGIIGAGLTGAATLVSMFATAIGAILSPVGLAIGAIAALGYWITFHTEAGAAALDWLKTKFQSLLAFIKPIVQGVKDALLAGDITLAAKVLWLGVKVAFAEGKVMVMGVWREFTTGLVQIFDEAINAIVDKWRNMNTSIAELLIKLGDKLGLLGSLKAEDVIATLREDSARAAKNSDRRLGDRTVARGGALSDATKADREELAKLRASLGAAVKQARVEAVEAELRRAKAQPPKPPEVPGLPALAMAGGGSRGTFSAVAAATLGRGADQQIKLLQSIDKRLADLNDTVEDSDPLLFAGE